MISKGCAGIPPMFPPAWKFSSAGTGRLSRGTPPQHSLQTHAPSLAEHECRLLKALTSFDSATHSCLRNKNRIKSGFCDFSCAKGNGIIIVAACRHWCGCCLVVNCGHCLCYSFLENIFCCGCCWLIAVFRCCLVFVCWLACLFVCSLVGLFVRW